jgi:hypothetical protein
VRSAVLQLPDARTVKERRIVLRAAIRQLERAEIYLDAVGYMDLGDREADRALGRLLSDLRSLQAYLIRLRGALAE